MSYNQRIGRWGEKAAADYLIGKGYEIIARNLRTPYGEIDLIARKEGFTIFVEVKTRTSSSLGPPEMAVSVRKQQHMLACAGYYAQDHCVDHWQIDVIAVEVIGGKIQLTHFENAVQQ